jgi:putative MATE family efflux protein
MPPDKDKVSSKSDTATSHDDGAATATAVAPPHPPARGGGRHHVRTDLTTGSVPKKLFSQAWPQAAEGVLNIADQTVDVFWAGRLPDGVRAIGGIGVAQTFTQFAGQFQQGFNVSMRAMIARAVGARNIPLANSIVFQGFFLTGIYSLIMVFIGLFCTDLFLRFINASEGLREQTRLYMIIQFVGNGTQSFRNATGAALQAAGEPVIPLRATTISRLLHIVLSPFLIFGWWGFPEMGLAGSALATVLAQVVGIGMNVWALMSGQSRLSLGLKGNTLDRKLIWQQLKIGAPASIRGSERATSSLVLLAIAAPFGDIALTAYSLSRRIEQFANFGSGGLGQASGVMVGQNLGAGNVARAKETIRWACLYALIMKLLANGLFYIAPFAIVGIFTQDPETLALTVAWMKIQLLVAIVHGLNNTLQESYNGAGDTLAPMVNTMLGVWLVEVPVAWYLCTQTDIGVLGIAWGAFAAFSARMTSFIIYYFQGRWMRVKVL